jgi:hypothetical protein
MACARRHCWNLGQGHYVFARQAFVLVDYSWTCNVAQARINCSVCVTHTHHFESRFFRRLFMHRSLSEDFKTGFTGGRHHPRHTPHRHLFASSASLLHLWLHPLLRFDLVCKTNLPHPFFFGEVLHLQARFLQRRCSSTVNHRPFIPAWVTATCTQHVGRSRGQLAEPLLGDVR